MITFIKKILKLFMLVLDDEPKVRYILLPSKRLNVGLKSVIRDQMIV